MKYNVGDKVRIKSLDWYNENKNEYGNVNCPLYVFSPTMRQYCGTIRTIKRVDNFDKKYKMTEDSCFFDWTDEMIEGLAEEENTLKIQSNDMETETHKGYCTTDVETTNESKKVAWFSFWDNDFADKVELDLSNRELIQEDGKWFVVKKKKEYPKTYEECCEVLGRYADMTYGYKKYVLHTLQMLLVCRDAYWQIAGAEMGLDEPWEPDWREKRYIIYRNQDDIIGGYREAGFVEHHIFEFPTKEMRDSFKENFKEFIEECKELL